ncbi:MAG: 50S ribosomal protein L7Ae [Candidatus Micrarchaeaceae archaeon]
MAYVKFKVSEETVNKTYEAIKLAKETGNIKKGANEVTKSVDRNLASFVVIAENVQPEEIVVHLPTLCEQKKIPYTYVPDKEALGKAIGLNSACTAIAIERKGKAEPIIAEIVAAITGVSQKEETNK